MNTLCGIADHAPCTYNGIVGCDKYANADSIICCIANADNNFLNEGIVEKSILFVDTKGIFEVGKLNVFEREKETPKLKVSRTMLPEAKFVGRVVMTANQYN